MGFRQLFSPVALLILLLLEGPTAGAVGLESVVIRKVPHVRQKPDFPHFFFFFLEIHILEDIRSHMMGISELPQPGSSPKPSYQQAPWTAFRQ